MAFQISIGSCFGHLGACQTGSDVIIQHLRLGVKLPLRLKFWVGIGDSSPLNAAYINKTGKDTNLRQTTSFLRACMFVRRSLRPVRDFDKHNKLIRRKVTKLFHLCVEEPFFK